MKLLTNELYFGLGAWERANVLCLLAYGTILNGHIPVYRLRSMCEGFIFNFLSKVTKCSV